MIAPLISYVTFNRLALTVKNLTAIFKSSDEFVMHIIDNGSTDGTWEYIQGLHDDRILSKTQISVNYGHVFAINLNLLKRKPEQYFITIDNDVFIETKDWISRFLKVFELFPEVGMLGIQGNLLDSKQKPSVISKTKSGICFFELDNSRPDIEKNYIPSCCLCLKPELINQIGYLCEENCFGDIELSNRVNNYTSFKSGFVTNISYQIPQKIECGSCIYNTECNLDKYNRTCFTNYNKLNGTEEFKKRYKWKFDETIADLKSGMRPVYCASMFDPDSVSSHIYNKEWAQENLSFYINR